MSRLTQLRQRIKTVATLQKTTHAMRLTSMSTHSRLQKKKKLLETYKNTIERIMSNCAQTTSVHKENYDKTKHLVITVGSQKGLCGAFNTRLMNLYEKECKNESYDLISIGKKVNEYLAQRSIIPKDSYEIFHANNFVEIAHEISSIILSNESEKGYTHVTIYSNHPQTFFLQESKKTELPVPKIKQLSKDEKSHDKRSEDFYHFEQAKSNTLLYLQNMYLKARIEDLLFKSLIAEQAARFVSMDSSTRNAEKLIESMQRDYNKLRQSLITRELTDLAGGIL